MHEAAAVALGNIALQASSRARIAAAGDLPPLVALLGASNSANMHLMAAGALRNIITSQADNKIRIIVAGAIPPRLALLGSHSTAAMYTAAEQVAAMESIGSIADANVHAMWCSGCTTAAYCSKGCQKADWKKTHRGALCLP